MLSRFIVVFLVFVFSSGFSLFSNEPGEDEIQQIFESQMPKGFSVSDVDIKANENVGSEADPRFKTRFVVEIEATMARFKRVNRIYYNNQNIDVVRKVVSKGEEFKFFGMAGSVLRNEKWVSRIVNVDSEQRVEGELLNAFNHPVMENSAEHKAELASQVAWDKAEDARRERKQKQIALERAQREEQEAKARAERKAKHAAAEQTRLADVKKQVAKLEGVWEGVGGGETPTVITFSSHGNSIEYRGSKCVPGELYLDRVKSKPSRLIFSEISKKPCSNSTDAIIPLDANSIRIEYVGVADKPFVLYRK